MVSGVAQYAAIVYSYAVAIKVSDVPLPATTWILGATLLVLGAVKRKNSPHEEGQLTRSSLPISAS